MGFDPISGSLIGCVVVGQGEFTDPDDGPPEEWDGGNWHGKEWTDDWQHPPDVRPPPNPTLVFTPPPRITFSDFSVRSSGGTFITPPMDLLTPGGNVEDPKISFIDATQNAQPSINELPLSVTGQLQKALQRNNLGKITATLTGLNQVASLRNGGRATIKVTLPQGEAAQKFYKTNSNLLNSISIEGTYTLAYFLHIPLEDYVEYQRFKGTFLVRCSITLKGDAPNLNSSTEDRAYTSQPKRAGYQNYHTIIPVPISNTFQARRRYYAEYFNGVENPAYTFFNQRTQTPPLNLKYSVGAPFSNLLDSTIQNILRINALSLAISDYPYNALTVDKVVGSLPSKTKDILSSSYTLDGVSLLPAVGKAIKNAVILDEISNFNLKEGDLENFKALTTNKEELVLFESEVDNNIQGVDVLLRDAVAIDPLSTKNMKTRNRLFNWRVLPEDINQRVIFKTAEESESFIYLTNQNPSITVTNFEGTRSTIPMQVGNYFVADPITGPKRLTVFSDIDKAVILPKKSVAQAARYLHADLSMTLDASSDTSALIELNVDTSTPRADGYFLKLDPTTITDVPSDSFLVRETQATYNYTTTGIDEYVQHRAFPYAVIYLRYDDMIFNHLEQSLNISLTHRDFTFDFVLPETDKILVRKLPQHILLVPTDNFEKTYSQARSKLSKFNTRSIRLEFSPFQGEGSLRNPVYLTSVYDQVNTVNFGQDSAPGMVYQEKIRYTYDSSAVSSLPAYRNGEQPTSRKILPTSRLFQTLNDIKVVFGLAERDSITTFDLYSRMLPHEIKGLSLDQPYESRWPGKLRLNKITEEDFVNKQYFVAVKSISSIDGKAPSFLPENPAAPQFTVGKTFLGTLGTASRFPTTNPGEKRSGGLRNQANY